MDIGKFMTKEKIYNLAKNMKNTFSKGDLVTEIKYPNRICCIEDIRGDVAIVTYRYMTTRIFLDRISLNQIRKITAKERAKWVLYQLEN